MINKITRVLLSTACGAVAGAFALVGIATLALCFIFGLLFVVSLADGRPGTDVFIIDPWQKVGMTTAVCAYIGASVGAFIGALTELVDGR